MGTIDNPGGSETDNSQIRRIYTDTFAGIAPQSAAIFILTHLTAATLVAICWRLLATFPGTRQVPS